VAEVYADWLISESKFSRAVSTSPSLMASLTLKAAASTVFPEQHDHVRVGFV
jgi:hypothetical protein